MIARDEIPFAPQPVRWQPANYAEQEAAKVSRKLGSDWLMARSDASMHRYRVNGPYWWLAIRYQRDFTTVHLFDSAREARRAIGHLEYWSTGTYCGHGRVRFKS